MTKTSHRLTPRGLSTGDDGFSSQCPGTKTSLSLRLEIMKSYFILRCSKTPQVLLKNTGGFSQEPILTSKQITVRNSLLSGSCGLSYAVTCLLIATQISSRLLFACDYAIATDKES